MSELKSYYVEFTPWDCGATFNTTSAGKAKYQYYIENQDVFNTSFYELLKYLKVRCTGLPHTSEDFVRNAIYRRIPFAYCGMMVKVGDSGRGHITGHNSSANINVLFFEGRYKGRSINVHPNCEVEYYSASGTVLKSFITPKS